MQDKTYYYHGTELEYASPILTRGFQLATERWGRGLGNGIYLSAGPAFAAQWGTIIIRCKLQPGTRILWCRAYEPKVIRYLRREFGSAILTPEGWKEVPRNKQLTRNELINLWHYLYEKHYGNPRRFEKRLLVRLQANYSRIFELLRRHGFDGVGCADLDWPEVLVFNPSKVIPVSAHHLSNQRSKLGASIPLQRLQRDHSQL